MEGQINRLERMIVVVARLLKDGQTVAAGTLSPIPAAACFLAKETSAPGLLPLIYGDPDNRLTEGLFELFGLAQQGRIEVFFLSAGQIDGQANLNLTVIGDYLRPQVRFPGGAGSSMLYALAGRTILFATTHSRKLLVPRVDFVTAAGTDGGEKIPWRRGFADCLVTPLALFRFDEGEKRLILESLLPGATWEEVAENTGFPLGRKREEVSRLPDATEEELAILRGKIRQKLKSIYPVFCRNLWGGDEL